MKQMPLTIQINDERAIRIVIEEAERRGINYRGGRQIAAAIIKEWRALATELGMSPTSRGRLKLTEAQGVVAARKVEQMRAEQDETEIEAVVYDIGRLVAGD